MPRDDNSKHRTDYPSYSPSYSPGLIMSEADLRALAERGRKLHAREIRRFFATPFRGLSRLFSSERAAPRKWPLWRARTGRQCC